ncbi:oxidoreductase [Mucilaginibacter celer]|uniref:SDR family NAD(P)-dependent oxidoreductase n=1 Tax=Mucilaginibacter celer TaxID=2305508 RepID=A0A494VTY7_9SPHI|nr:oxidoreductase [Mucilaginibacter celer]AYL96920.1 SDR family NAD(P)-dependent oxidoreductase [Mucilaginibacter celer]
MDKKVILITGASAGIGKAFAEELLKDGHTVYGAARRVDKMDTIAKQGVKVLAMDVTDEAAMAQGIDTIIKAEGRIDVLINNAGFGLMGAIEDTPLSDARYQLEVNLFGVARLTQLVLPHMRKQRSGTIINISSIGGKFAMPLGGWYHASKFALEAMSDALRNEVKQFGINVVVIEPGGIQSEWGGIAVDNLLKVSGKGPYAPMANKFVKAFTQSIDAKLPGPTEIVKLVRKAIAAKKPKTRYHAGHMAGLALFMRWLLPDNAFDKMMSSQLK